MDETYNLKAFIISRESFREFDSKVTVYSSEKGKLDLVARGTKKLKSKLAAHIEPISLSNLMAVRGKSFDYIGSATLEEGFANIKIDYDKIETAGRGIEMFNNLIKNEEKDEEIFKFLGEFFDVLSKNKNFDHELTSSFFSLGLFSRLGFKPELYHCVNCGKKLVPKGNRIGFDKGGVICENCARGHEPEISENGIKVMRLGFEKKLSELINLKIEDKARGEAVNLAGSFVKYHF